MDKIDITLASTITVLIIISAVFSACETALMAVNRYKIQHQAKKGCKASSRIKNMLKTPDKVLSIILIMNTLANLTASALTTILAQRHFNEDVATLIIIVLLTPVVLIFAEISPKTYAAYHPEKIIFPCSLPITWLMKIMKPISAVINAVANLLLKSIGMTKSQEIAKPLSNEELRSMLLHQRAASQNMLIGILDINNLIVNDVMKPRNAIDGIDLEQQWHKIITNIKSTKEAEIIVYFGDLENIIGSISLTTIIDLLNKGCLNKNTIKNNSKKVTLYQKALL